MRNSKQIEDIQNRYSLALAERNFTELGSEHYKVLSEVARLILKEYENAENPRKRNRYGCRFYDGKYHIVILKKNEQY